MEGAFFLNSDSKFIKGTGLKRFGDRVRAQAIMARWLGEGSQHRND
ncbi:MAG: hypothetical protein AAGD92_09025 [Pseudomonadota bacterium]